MNVIFIKLDVDINVAIENRMLNFNTFANEQSYIGVEHLTEEDKIWIEGQMCKAKEKLMLKFCKRFSKG